MAYDVKVPQGFQEQKSELAGFWDPLHCPIRCIPREVHLSDNKADSRKWSGLIIAELVEPCELPQKERGEVTGVTQGKKGDLVGIWYKPGMKGILNCGNVDTYVYSGEGEEWELDTGKPNAMQLFKVLSKTRGTSIPLTGDFRKSSAREGHPFGALVGSSGAADAGAPPFG